MSRPRGPCPTAEHASLSIDSEARRVRGPFVRRTPPPCPIAGPELNCRQFGHRLSALRRRAGFHDSGIGVARPMGGLRGRAADRVQVYIFGPIGHGPGG